jgi:hypothetical protein
MRMKSFKPMKLAWLLLLSAALAPAFVLWAAPIPTGPIYTRQLAFRIPFHFDSNELSRLGAREIRLYVSRDRGRTWNLDKTVFSEQGRFNPEANKFKFQATGDGEYWFLVRTLDSKNHLHPDMNATDPGLQVVVDATPPRLQLDLEQPAAGTVQLSWKASDDHLDPTQLRLEYLQPGSSDWQPVSVVPKASGQTGWKVSQGGEVAVRGSIADLAGNSARDEVRLRILPASQTVPRPGAPDVRQPVAGPVSDPAAGPGSEPRDNLALNMPDQFPSTDRTPQAGPAESASPPAKEASQIVRWPSAETPPAIAGAKNSFVSHKPDNHSAIAPEPVPRVPEHLQRSTTASRRRVVDSRKFQIGYNLEGVGPSGIGSVELYITEDNGTNWYHYGADDDHQSPILVEVPREGTYGFALGVRSGAGLTSEPPQKGDPPSIVVVVDQTTPRLEMFPVEQGLGKNVNKLLISWRCEDENLAEKPVSLFYSPSGQAPWLPISGPAENTGRFVWTIGSGLPVKLYLRIEARDLAGHVQTIDSPQPIVVDLSRPTAKIIDVELPISSGVPR